MAPRRRAAAQAVSYEESESELDDQEQDDDFSSSDDASPPPRSRRTKQAPQAAASSSRTARTRSQPRKIYAENDTEESDSDSSDGDSVDDDDDDDDDVNTSVRAAKPQKARASASRPRGRPKKNAASTASPRRGPRRRNFPESSPPPTVPRRKAQPKQVKGPSQADLWFMGKPCAWTDLPFEILRDILSYASYPLFDDRGQATPHVSWLLKFRNIHPALLEASLAALYFTPPITSEAMGHSFLSLMMQPSNRTTNYNVKVRHLELEARSTLAYSAGAELGSLDLGTLVLQLPQLIGIDIWTIMDNPEIRKRALAWGKWSYPDSLFEALAQGKQRLRHFHWNSRFMAKELASDPMGMYQWMETMHKLPAFQSLTYVKLTSFLGETEARIDLAFPIDFASPGKTLTLTQQNKEAARVQKKALQEKQDEALAKALESLPSLRKLDLYMCSVVDGDWLQLLPKQLTHLGIIECDRITSEGLQEFLGTHGHHLQVLVLNLNPELKISFLTSLAMDCPSLQELSMDLTAIRKPDAGEIVASGDDGFILQPDEKPSWPKTLQNLCFNHVHYLPSSAAELFFNSLIESATNLPDLRQLTLSVSLDIDWRERAKMRDVWEDKFKRVFLRKSTPPNSAWWSLSAYHTWKNKKVAEVLISPPKPGIMNSITEAVEETATDDDDDDDMPVRNGKRKAPTEAPTRRLRPRRHASDEESDAPVSALGGSLRDMVMQTLEMHIQGMCDEVDVRIDNFRPRDEQFSEGDFLDPEPSDDEDWNGVDLDFDELYPNGYRKKKRR